MPRHDCKPVIFLINNGGYTIERGYMGKTSDYNDIARWAYTELPKVFRPDTTAQSFVVKTVADLERALCAPNDSLILIGSVMDPYDAPAAVIHSSNNGAELDYGPAARSIGATRSFCQPTSRGGTTRPLRCETRFKGPP
jgi:indolepyruvate decarboxylase